MYSRYIPPPKAKEPAKASAKTASSTPPTRVDASATYNRYVPATSKSKPSANGTEIPIIASRVPAKRTEESDIVVSTQKNRKPKKLKRDPNCVEQQQVSSLNANGSGHSSKTERQSKVSQPNDTKAHKFEDAQADKNELQDKGKVAEIRSESSRLSEAETDSIHKRILSKRDKSIRKGEKLAKKEAARLAESGDAVKDKNLIELQPLGPLPEPEPVSKPSGPAFSARPLWLSSPIRVSRTSKKSFSDFNLPIAAVEVLKKSGFGEAFAIQAAALPLLLTKNTSKVSKRGDILISAATGSGKTLAYVLPLVADISATIVPRLRGLIVVPTRELVNQARAVCETCVAAFQASKRRKLVIGTAVGNQTLKSEQSMLMQENFRYDPEGYRKRECRLNRKWRNTDAGGGEGGSLDDELDTNEEDDAPILPNHVKEYTSNVDILICTPGRLVEHLKSTPGFTLSFLKWLIMDEADKLLDQSFQQWLPVVMSQLPRKDGSIIVHDVTKIVCSATLTQDIGQLSELKLFRPQLVVLGASESLDSTKNHATQEALNLPSNLHESAIKIEEVGNKPLYLLHILHQLALNEDTSKQEQLPMDEEEPTSSSDSESLTSTSEEFLDAEAVQQRRPRSTNSLSSKSKLNGVAIRGCLVFTKSNENAVRLCRLISIIDPQFASKSGVLTSVIPHSMRRDTLSSFRAGKITVLFASDLVARGLDISNLATVINYDMPTSVINYVHRVGRTARAGKDGGAITLFENNEGRWFWNEIARGGGVNRADRLVARTKVDSTTFTEQERKGYEIALKTLEMEARTG